MEYALSELFTLQMGKTPSRDNSSYWKKSENNWISIADLTNSGKYISNTKETLSDSAVAESGIKKIPANTVIMSFKLSLGKVAITEKEMYSNEAIMAFIDKGVEKISPEYLYYLLRAKDWSKGTNKAVMGATLNKATLSTIKIQLHEYDNQLEIVNMLNRVSSSIDFRKQQLTKLDELIKARFVEMFGDPKLNPYRFPCNSLSTYITFLTSGSRGWSQYFTDSGEYFITIKNVKNCKITLQDVQYVAPPDNAEAKRTKVQKNDLLISITADLGRTGVVTEEIANHGAYINQHLTCIRLKDEQVNPLYVAYYMESDAGKEQFTAKNQSAVKAGLNFNAINSLKLMAPPLSLQNQFAAFVAEVDKSKLFAELFAQSTCILAKIVQNRSREV
jgi:type I restriction enzyme S subunit